MPNPDILILGYSEAAMFLTSPTGKRVNSIISIHGQREFGVESTVKQRIDLTFDDVDIPNPKDTMSLHKALSRKQWNEKNGLVESPPTVDDVKKIIQFARDIEDAGGMLLCHCFAGMSRAPAAALICLSVWSNTGNETDLVARVRSLRRGAFPHPGIIQIADQMLARNGKLIAAVNALNNL